MPLTFVSVIGDDASHYNVSSSPTPLASTSSAALSTLVILLTTTLAILWYRHHHAHRRWRRAGAAEEDDRQYLRAETTTSMTTSTSPPKQTETMTTPSTNPAIKKEVADDAMTTMVELKLDFLSRYKGQYGYANSKKGNIDNWRNDEFPSLIPPLKVQPSSLDRQRDELPSTLQSPSSLQINHDDDELYQRKIVPNNVKSDTDGDEDSTDTIDKEVYLDSAGSALPSKSLLHQIYMHEQQYQILANPHSYGGGRASDRTIKLMRKAEECVLRHFGTLDVSEDENAEKSGDIAVDSDRKAEEGVTTASSFNPGYRVIFTSGATDSLRLVAERFPWSYAQFTADSSSCSSSSTSQRFCMTLIDEGGHAVSNGAIDTASPPPPPPSLSPTLSNRVKSIRLSSILLYPTNVHTSVIGMRQIALQHGGQFHCVSVEELLGATADWFQDLLRRSVAYDYWNDVDDDLQQKKDVDEDHDEWIAEDMPNLTQVGSNEDAMETKGAIPCKTIWLHHLLVLPLECNFGGDRFDWSKTTAMARKSCVTSHYLHWTNNMRQEGKESKTMIIRHKWHVLLDTAKAAATSPVHLPTLAHGGGPDFAVVSFYKLFGTPTGLGALLIKRQHRRRRKNSRIHRGNWKDESMDNPVDAMIGVAVSDITSTRQVVNDGIIMERNISPRYYFGGGSVDVVLPEKDFVSSRNAYVTLSNNQVMLHHEPDGDEHVDLGVLTHGTQNFRGIAQLIHGFQEIDDYGGMEKVSSANETLTSHSSVPLSLCLLSSGQDIHAFHLSGH